MATLEVRGRTAEAPPGQNSHQGLCPQNQRLWSEKCQSQGLSGPADGGQWASYFMKKEKLSLSLPVSLVSSHCGSWVCAHCLSAPFCNSAPGSSKVLAWAGLGAPEPPSHLLTRRSEIITCVSSPHPQPKSTWLPAPPS